jgi:hypothetical protein
MFALLVAAMMVGKQPRLSPPRKKLLNCGKAAKKGEKK